MRFGGLLMCAALFFFNTYALANEFVLPGLDEIQNDEYYYKFNLDVKEDIISLDGKASIVYYKIKFENEDQVRLFLSRLKTKDFVETETNHFVNENLVVIKVEGTSVEVRYMGNRLPELVAATDPGRYFPAISGLVIGSMTNSEAEQFVKEIGRKNKNAYVNLVRLPRNPFMGMIPGDEIKVSLVNDVTVFGFPGEDSISFQGSKLTGKVFDLNIHGYCTKEDFELIRKALSNKYPYSEPCKPVSKISSCFGFYKLPKTSAAMAGGRGPNVSISRLYAENKDGLGEYNINVSNAIALRPSKEQMAAYLNSLRDRQEYQIKKIEGIF